MSLTLIIITVAFLAIQASCYFVTQLAMKMMNIYTGDLHVHTVYSKIVGRMIGTMYVSTFVYIVLIVLEILINVILASLGMSTPVPGPQ